MADKRRAQASQDDDGRYRLLVDAITDYAVYMLDVDGVVSSWNAGAQRFKGYTADEIIGENFARFYTDEDRATGLPQLALHTAATEGRFEREGWRVRKDGSRFWAHVVIDPVRTPDGVLLGFAKITRDLTERRDAEAALRRSEQQFRLLVQGVTDYAIYMLDPQGYVSNWNAGAERIKGYKPEEIVGRHFSQFYTEEERTAGAPAKGLATAARVGRSEKEGWRVRKDGTRFWAHVVIDAIRDDDGQLIGFAKVTRDITERLATQQALDKARDALFQAQKLDALGQLTGGVAHDFNNLLMAVLGSLELVRKRLPEDPRITPLIDNAIQGAERGAALTQRMLAFARRQELTLEAVDVGALVGGIKSFIARAIGPTVEIRSDIPDGLPKVQTDANQLETALLNLAVNARDAMPDGGAITISAQHDRLEAPQNGLAPGDYVRLRVSDTGDGMDEQTLARATEPFFTTKGVGKGTGLGLSMVHGLAAQSGGQMTIASARGQGTTVQIWLPLAHADTPRLAKPAAPETTSAGALNILAVDDDPLVLMNTAALMEDLGHTVAIAASGAEALVQLRAGLAPDLVVTDQAMPGMTGLQLRAAIAAEWPQLPVLIATGYAELPVDADAGLQRIAKPFTQAALAVALGQAVMATPAQRTPVSVV